MKNFSSIFVVLSALLLGCAANATNTNLVFGAGNWTWTCPAGVTSVTLECWGGGGGGGGAGVNYAAAGGGAGGSYIKNTITVTPGTTYNLTVGAGGTAGAGGTVTGTSGGTGGSSYFGNTSAGNSTGALILAVGGNGGAANNTLGVTGTRTASNGGTAQSSGNIPGSGATASFYGVAGTNATGGSSGNTKSGGGAPGAGSSSAISGGVGGAALTSAGNGNAGSSPGAGGSGGYQVTSTSNGTGGAGGAGLVAITTGNITFTPGNLVVERIGDGLESYSSSGQTIFLDEFKTGGSGVQSFQIPDSGATALIDGSAASDGGMTRSADARFLCFPGYNTAEPFGSSLAGSGASVVPRGVGIVDINGVYTLVGTSTTNYSANNIRGAAADGNGNFWAAGTASTVYGINYYGTNNIPTNVYSANLRDVYAFGTNLWYSTGSTTPGIGIWKFSGAPTNNVGNTATEIISITNTANTASPYHFAMDNPANPTVIYYADDGSGSAELAANAGIHKWTNNGTGTWSQAYILLSSDAVYGLAVDWSTTPATIYATTGSGLAGNSLLKVQDTGAGATAATLATTAANSSFRNVQFAPKGSTTVAVNSSFASRTNGYLSSVTFTATLPAAATGNVVFLTNGVPLSTNALSAGTATSAATAALPRGSNSVTAQYSGDYNYFGSTNNLSGGEIVTNHPPVAANVVSSRNTGISTWKIAVANLLTNVTDADGDTISLTSVSTSTNGVIPTISGGFVFYSNTNNVSDQFTYNVNDGFGGTASALVSLTINANTASGQAQSVAISGGLATVNFAGIPGFSYDVQRSTNLISWTTIWTTNPVAGVFQYADNFSDLGGTIPSSAYYRLTWNP